MGLQDKLVYVDVDGNMSDDQINDVVNIKLKAANLKTKFNRKQPAIVEQEGKKVYRFKQIRKIPENREMITMPLRDVAEGVSGVFAVKYKTKKTRAKKEAAEPQADPQTEQTKQAESVEKEPAKTIAKKQAIKSSGKVPQKKVKGSVK